MTDAPNFAIMHGGAQSSWISEETRAAFDLQMGEAPYRAEAFDLPGNGAKRGMDIGAALLRKLVARGIHQGNPG